MSEIPDVTGGTAITTSWGNPIKDRTVMRYANAAARDASVVAPVSGDVAYLVDVAQITVWDGGAWRSQVTLETGDLRYVEIVGDEMSGTLLVQTAQDTAGVWVRAGGGAGDGGQIDFGFANIGTPYAQIRGNGADGTLNTSGGIAFYTRENPGDAALGRAMRILSGGGVLFDNGAEVPTYDPSPSGGGDIYAGQIRNVTYSDALPTGGKDGDMWVHYANAASTRGADVYVRVAGTWRGQT